MASDLVRNWMWSEACAMLARTESLRREFFRPSQSALSAPSWEPPVDILETEREVLILIALPGVSADHVEVAIKGADLVISGCRTWPLELKIAIIHRLELPQGRFERRVRLPAGTYSAIRQTLSDGYFMIRLEKAR